VSAARIDAVDKGLPRRLSTRSCDRDFDEAAGRLSDRIAVMLDGVELAEVAAYDADNGRIVRRKRGKDNSLILDEQGVPSFEVLTGEVEVRWSKGSGT
jgi:hypothetical protein